jgi:copper chaperone CopZ
MNRRVSDRSTVAARTVLGKTFRDHIGGRWAISWQAYALNVPLNFLAISTSIRVEPVGAQWWGWALVALAGLAAIAVVFVAASLTVLRRRREQPVAIWVVVAVGALTGIFRGGVVVAVASLLLLQPFTVEELINRMVAGGVVGAAALPVAALTFSVVSTYRSERHRLIDEMVAIERERLQQQGDIETLRATLVQGVHAEVTAALESVSGADPRTVSEAMRKTSHRIWDDEAEIRERHDGRIRHVLWTSVRSRPLPVVPTLVLWGVSALGTLVGAAGPLRGLWTLAYALVALWLSLLLANRWIRNRPEQWGVATVVMLTVAYILTSPVSYLLFDPGPVESALPIMLMNAIWLPTVVFLVAISTGAVASGEFVLQQMANDVNAAEIRGRAVAAERDDMLRDIAARLHGTAHSPMVAGTALLSHSDDPAAHERLVEYVGQAVAQMDSRDRSIDLVARLRSIGVPWDGLVNVRVDIDPAANTVVVKESTRRLIERIVEEGIANAYRHGGASQVAVEVRVQDSELVLLVTDNGSGPPSAREPGLGCRLFETAAPGGWSLRPGDSAGAVLIVHLPA